MNGRLKAIRVVTADANQMACGLLSEALSKQPGIAVVASAADYDSLMRSLAAVKPDIALISADLPGRPLAANAAPSIRNTATPSCPWVMLLDKSEPGIVVASFRAGAKGVFSRCHSDIRLLAKCIRRVVEGQVWVDSRQMTYLLDALVRNDTDRLLNSNSTPRLTRREVSVVRLVVQGMVNREIAEELHLSEHTIKNYLFRIFDKLGVSNRVELALYAVAKLHLEDVAA
jgi:DNA-binding NarL/FixJ family response regulator